MRCHARMCATSTLAEDEKTPRTTKYCGLQENAPFEHIDLKCDAALALPRVR